MYVVAFYGNEIKGIFKNACLSTIKLINKSYDYKEYLCFEDIPFPQKEVNKEENKQKEHRQVIKPSFHSRMGRHIYKAANRI